MSEPTRTTPVQPQDLTADAGGWAPLGWTPSDSGWVDDAPFGSVLGDPLMGSPLFDDAAAEEARARRIASYGVSPNGAGFSGGAAQGGAGAVAAARTTGDDAAGRLRAEMERQQQVLRQRAAQHQGGQPPRRSSAQPVPRADARYGRLSGAQPGSAQRGRAAADPYGIRRQPAQAGYGAPRTARAAGRVASAQAERMRPVEQRELRERQDARSGKAASKGSGAGSAIGWIVFLLIIMFNVLGH